MRVFSIIFLFLVLVFLDSPGRADDAKPVDLKTSSALGDEYSADLTEMHNYMKSQQEKEQKIQLLTLDLEQANGLRKVSLLNQTFHQRQHEQVQRLLKRE